MNASFLHLACATLVALFLGHRMYHGRVSVAKAALWSLALPVLSFLAVMSGMVFAYEGRCGGFPDQPCGWLEYLSRAALWKAAALFLPALVGYQVSFVALVLFYVAAGIRRRLVAGPGHGDSPGGSAGG